MFYMKTLVLRRLLVKLKYKRALRDPQSHRSVVRRYWEKGKNVSGVLLLGEGVVSKELALS